MSVNHLKFGWLPYNDKLRIKSERFDEIFRSKHSKLFSTSTDEVNRVLELPFSKLLNRMQLREKIQFHVGRTQTINFTVLYSSCKRIPTIFGPVLYNSRAHCVEVGVE